MQNLKQTKIFVIAAFVTTMLFAFTSITKSKKNTYVKPEQQKIQVAILLDVSNSMDGLIAQAKSQLWNMVSVMGKAKCGNYNPSIEIALYEYGRTNNSENDGYVKQINGFITSLDSVSENLFKLTTNGGEEYCGEVIYKSIADLKWDNNPLSYKVIFIAGNEDFLQGKKQYTEGCSKAKENGIIVNTIYCGDKMQGIREHWNLGAECGQGSFTNINSNAREIEIPTPYDSIMYVLNSKINSTYVTYGAAGASNQAKQVSMDYENDKLSKSAGIKRANAKAQKSVYRNDDWDLVDGIEKNVKILDMLDKNTLPDSLKNKTNEEILVIVNKKATERATIQKEITTLNIQREAFITNEKKRMATNTNEQTLETEVEKIIKVQAKRFKMTFD